MSRLTPVTFLRQKLYEIMRKMYLVKTLLLFSLCGSGQQGPLTFDVARWDHVIPSEPNWSQLQYKGLHDTIDYRGRKISKETILGRERHYDSLGRLIKEINRSYDTAINNVQTWEFIRGGTIYTATSYSQGSCQSRSEVLVIDSQTEEQAAAPKEHHQLSLSYMVDGEWKLYYSAKYDSTGKLLYQSEDTRVHPNDYFIGGVLYTVYNYDGAGRCTGYTTTNDSGSRVSEFRCIYNSKGQVVVWDGRYSAMWPKAYDSLTYNEEGNVNYAFHQMALEQSKEYLLEYDQHGKVIRCLEKINGELTWEHIYYREKGLLLTATTIQHKFGPVTTSRSVWHYEFYE